MAKSLSGPEAGSTQKETQSAGPYAWLVFALSFGLMLSDYMSRQVLIAVFPSLKAAWGLSDTQLGALVSVVALTLAVMTFPIALLADRWGRVKSVAVMAIVWGLATIACGLSGNFMMMFAARAVIGLGQAGYGSAGAAILIGVFPPRLRATVLGTFFSAAMFGAVLGVMLGGMIAKYYSWRTAFVLVGVVGLVLAVLYPLVVREPPSDCAAGEARIPLKTVLRDLLTNRTLNWIYLGSGLLMFVQATLIAWMPSYLNRFYGIDIGKAAMGAAALVLAAGVGMPLGGALVDRLSRGNSVNKLRIPMLYAVISSLLLLAAFLMPPGIPQLILVGLSLLVGAGFTGPAAAVVSELTPPSIRAASFGVLTLAFCIYGLAPGPFLVGILADAFGLQTAMKLLPVAGFASAAAYLLACGGYRRDQEHLAQAGEGAAQEIAATRPAEVAATE